MSQESNPYFEELRRREREGRRLRVGVVGAGTMGRGIAQIAAAAGHDDEAVELLGNIPDEAAAAPDLRFPLAQLHATIRMRTGKRTAAFATACADVPALTEGADLVLVHEWNEPELVAAIAGQRHRQAERIVRDRGLVFGGRTPHESVEYRFHVCTAHSGTVNRWRNDVDASRATLNCTRSPGTEPYAATSRRWSSGRSTSANGTPMRNTSAMPAA